MTGPEAAAPVAELETNPDAENRSVLVEDGVAVGPDQLSRTAFLDRLDDVVRSSVEGVLRSRGWSKRRCPYVGRYLERFRAEPIADLEAGIRPWIRPDSDTADDWFEAIAERTREAAVAWRDGRSDPLLRQVVPSADTDLVGSTHRADPRAVIERLGEGEPLPSGVRARAESAFGVDFSRVRVHVDEFSQRVASETGARAFTVGEHVGFATGAYRPETLVGDAMLAHELAHTMQQAGSIDAGRNTSALEHEADNAARTVLLGGRRTVAPGRGLMLQSCTPKTSDPKALIPIADLIRYVEDVERAYPRDSRDEIISRLRVQYYGGMTFGQLIPDAHAADFYYQPPMREGAGGSSRLIDRDINAAPAATREHLRAHADENGVQDNPSPYIVMPDGSKIDLGHMLLGLDALIHPRTDIPFTTYGIGNIDPASFVADLALASVWTTQHNKTGSPGSGAPRTSTQTGSARLDDYWTMSAPVEDLVGDVDSFGMHTEYAAHASAPLSQLLRGYYLGSSPRPPAVTQRWQTFCARAGLTYTRTGISIVFDPAVRTTLSGRVDRMSDLVDAGATGAGWAATRGSPTHRAWPLTGAVVDRFLAYVGRELAAELARSAAPRPTP